MKKLSPSDIQTITALVNNYQKLSDKMLRKMNDGNMHQAGRIATIIQGTLIEIRNFTDKFGEE